MAGARDVTRTRKQIREAQRERNRKAQEEREKRISEMERVAEMDPSERRKWKKRERQKAVDAVREPGSRRVHYVDRVVGQGDEEDSHVERVEVGRKGKDDPQVDTEVLDEEATDLADRGTTAEAEAKMDRTGHEDKMQRPGTQEDKGPQEAPGGTPAQEGGQDTEEEDEDAEEGTSGSSGDDPLAGIQFDSPTAEELARDAHLGADAFAGVEPSGADGGYLTGDVRKLLEEQDDG